MVALNVLHNELNDCFHSLTMEPVVPRSSVAKSPGLFSSSGSASFHNRLTISSSSSQRRFRVQARNDDDEVLSTKQEMTRTPELLHADSVDYTSPSLPLYDASKHANSSSRKHPMLRWIVITYCLLSMILFASRLLVVCRGLLSHLLTEQKTEVSPVNSLSHPFRMSKILPITPEPVAFIPFALQTIGTMNDSDVTACLWIELADLNSLELWSKQWQGPMSVVLVTVSAPTSIQSELSRLEKSIQWRGRLSIHILQKLPNSSLFGNAYLNLARSFAQSRFVTLFPAPPKAYVPKGLYDGLSDKLNTSQRSKIVSPFVVSHLKHNSLIPFSMLSPIVIEQAHPVWCTERFFSSSYRADDWEECLWQLWLNSYGELKTFVVREWKDLHDQDRKKSTEVLSSEEVVHRRLSHRFRHELCILTARRLKERAERPNKIDAQKAQWLRRICRHVLNNWVKDLPN